MSLQSGTDKIPHMSNSIRRTQLKLDGALRGCATKLPLAMGGYCMEVVGITSHGGPRSSGSRNMTFQGPKQRATKGLGGKVVYCELVANCSFAV